MVIVVFDRVQQIYTHFDCTKALYGFFFMCEIQVADCIVFELHKPQDILSVKKLKHLRSTEAAEYPMFKQSLYTDTEIWS